MANDLQVFNFEQQSVRVILQDGEPWWVAKDVADVLGIVNSRDAVSALDDDEKNTVGISDGKRGNPNMTIISESGLYTLIMRSNKPEAKRFRKWVTSEVLPSIRKTGSYSVNNKKISEFEAKRLKLAEERLAIQAKNANARLAKIIQHMVDSPAYALTKESKQILAHEVTVLTTGHEHPEMLPDQTEQYYSASEIGKEIGLSNRKIMRAARELNIIPPEGEANEYGRWKMSKSPYSSHECAQWYFSDRGRQALRSSIFIVADKADEEAV